MERSGDGSQPLDGVGERLADQFEEAVHIASHPQVIPVNLYEADGAYVVVAPVPGVMAEDIEVIVEPGSLHLRAAMRTPAPKEYLRHEWHYGPFERTIELPPGCGGATQASFGNGQLAVRLLKGAEPSGRTTVVPAG